MMTPEERLARLEARVDGVDGWLADIARDVKALRSIADAGNGGLKVILKFGVVVVAVLTGIWAVVNTAIALLDKIPHLK